MYCAWDGGGAGRAAECMWEDRRRLGYEKGAELLNAEQVLAEQLLAEQLLDAEHLSHRRLARTVVTNLESLLLRLAEKSSHVHITERVLYTEVQRKGSVAYHRDPAAIGFDLPQRQTVTGCRRTQLALHSPLTHTTCTYHLNFDHAQ